MGCTASTAARATAPTCAVATSAGRTSSARRSRSNDQDGELIGPVITGGRQTPGLPAMPPLALPPDDLKAIAAYVHSVQATMQRAGIAASGPARPALNILVGDAAAGQAYFNANCSACHSPTGDLQGIGAPRPIPMQLQNLWVGGGRGRGGRAGGAAGSRRTAVRSPSR